jgi:hypothetical protein
MLQPRIMLYQLKGTSLVMATMDFTTKPPALVVLGCSVDVSAPQKKEVSVFPSGEFSSS